MEAGVLLLGNASVLLGGEDTGAAKVKVCRTVVVCNAVFWYVF